MKLFALSPLKGKYFLAAMIFSYHNNIMNEALELLNFFKSQGKSQMEMSQVLGCSQAHISNVKHGRASFSPEQMRVLCSLKAGLPEQVLAANTGSEEQVTEIPQETEEEMWQRIEESYEDLESVVRLVGSGKANSAIFNGLPGLGKTYTIEKTLNDMGVEYKKISGSGSSSQLYRQLFENQDGLILLDDCDAFFSDEEAMNILKAALDTGTKPRVVSWMKHNKTFEAEDIPNQFEYRGQVIIISNVKFSPKSKLAAHFAAIESRSLSFDMKMDSRKEVLVRLKQLAPKILGEFHQMEREEILEFFEENLYQFKTLSIREMVKLAEIYGCENWKRLCKRIFLK